MFNFLGSPARTPLLLCERGLRANGRMGQAHLHLVTYIFLLENSATPPRTSAPALRSYASHPPFPFATSEFKNK